VDAREGTCEKLAELSAAPMMGQNESVTVQCGLTESRR
jgi:hypothetical protein